MLATKVSVNKIEERGHSDGVCSKCGAVILTLATGRSLWIKPFKGGRGKVAQVAEVYCPTCDGEPAMPEYGRPIYTDEVCEILTHA